MKETDPGLQKGLGKQVANFVLEEGNSCYAHEGPDGQVYTGKRV